MTREQILEFQARWMRPAGIAAILGAALIVGSGVVGRIGIPAADDNVEQLLVYQDHAGQLELSHLISSLGLLTLAVPLYFLFRSALARADRMRGFVGALVLVGPLLIAVQGTLLSLALADASDQYVAGVPAVEAKAREAAAKGSQPGGCAKPADQCVTDARDDFAEDKIRDSGKFQAANVTGLIGGLALIGGAVYTLLWSMRTGLLTRFAAMLGMIFIAALLLIPQLGPIGLVLWFAIVGLMFAGWWPRPLPPAWAAAEAIPWLRPGEGPGPPPGRGPAGTVEGSGREVSEPPAAGQLEGPSPGETQGERRKKRKRRR